MEVMKEIRLRKRRPKTKPVDGDLGMMALVMMMRVTSSQVKMTITRINLTKNHQTPAFNLHQSHLKS